MSESSGKAKKAYLVNDNVEEVILRTTPTIWVAIRYRLNLKRMFVSRIAFCTMLSYLFWNLRRERMDRCISENITRCT